MRKQPTDRCPTPGPWHVYRGANFTKVAPAGFDKRVERTHYLGGAICKLDDWTGKEHDNNAPWVLPNAHLIAAAPELLEALRGVVGWWRDTSGVIADPIMDELIAAADAAIANAEGS